jgi:hypothetical protein
MQPSETQLDAEAQGGRCWTQRNRVLPDILIDGLFDGETKTMCYISSAFRKAEVV